MIKALKNILIITLFIITLLAFYVLIAYGLTFFPSNPIGKDEKKTESIYLLYSNLHSDIILPIATLDKKWKEKLPQHIINSQGYLSFGWGDKAFYLNTPTWDDVKVAPTLKALFLNTPSIIYVKHYPKILYFKNLKTIKISKNQLRALEDGIFKSFDFKGKAQRGYGRDDLFYDSPYNYNLINTCNTWTGERLQDANISVSYWTPFSWNVIESTPKE